MKTTRLCAFLIVSAVAVLCLCSPVQGIPPPPPPQGTSPVAAPTPAQSTTPVPAPAAPRGTSPTPGPSPAQGAPMAPGPSPAPAVSGPIIQFDSTSFDFGKAAYGTKVQHAFNVTNKGDQPLEITNVRPSCHCTVAGAWTHRIEPGQSGVVPVQYDTAGGGPGSITKTIEVTSNAKNDPRVILWLKGTVWKPIDVMPPTAYINIAPDATNGVSTTVRIVNQTETPVKLSAPICSAHCFAAALKETKVGKEFELIITAEPPFNTGNTPGTISMNCSYPGTPVVNVTAIAAVAQAVQFYPSQINLNALAEDRWFTNRVIIKGVSTNFPLSLSNPVSSDSRIQVEVQPAGPAGMFSLIVAVPPGFQLAPGQRAEVSVQSNHPRFPVIRVPINQISRPVPRRVATLAGQPNPPAQNYPASLHGGMNRVTNTAPPAPPVPNPPAPAGQP